MNLVPVGFVLAERQFENSAYIAQLLHSLEVVYHEDELDTPSMSAGERARWTHSIRLKLAEYGVDAAPPPEMCRTTSTIEALDLRAQFHAHQTHQFDSPHCFWCRRRQTALAGEA